jgi:hypothetical protein
VTERQTEIIIVSFMPNSLIPSSFYDINFLIFRTAVIRSIGGLAIIFISNVLFHSLFSIFILYIFTLLNMKRAGSACHSAHDKVSTIPSCKRPHLDDMENMADLNTATIPLSASPQQHVDTYTNDHPQVVLDHGRFMPIPSYRRVVYQWH